MTSQAARQDVTATATGLARPPQASARRLRQRQSKWRSGATVGEFHHVG
jgi:hypothetical protein